MKRTMFTTEFIVDKEFRSSPRKEVEDAEKLLSEQELALLSRMGDKSVFGVDALYAKFKARGLVS